jgi:ubiquinone/menaquinone biosynthesis C-methylase UbiE
MKIATRRPPQDVARDDGDSGPGRAGAVPPYLERVYWWAYVHPRAVRVFERDWLVNLILFGNYRRLCDEALAALGTPLSGRTLQVACVYGDLTPRMRGALAPDARLDVVDVLPVQLANLAAKLPPDPRVTLRRCDAASLPMSDGHYDRTLLFFLLHEMPDLVRRRTIAEAMRVTKPGGQVVVVDYHRPAPWHPLRLPMGGIFRTLEPYAPDLWRTEIADFLPPRLAPRHVDRRTYFGGLYQRVILTRA